MNRHHDTHSIGRFSRIAIAIGWLVLQAGSAQAEAIYLPLPALQLVDQRVANKGCFDNLAHIIEAAHVYAIDTEDQFPPGLQDLSYLLESPGLLFCPADGGRQAPTNWAEVNWGNLSYDWVATTNRPEPNEICVRCRVHQNVAWAEGSVHKLGRFQPGWPEVIASPMNQFAEPGWDVQLQARTAPDALTPWSYQWRREKLYYVTNATFVENPEVPHTGTWVTNVLPKYTVIPLAGQTNAACVLRQVSTNDTDFYSLAVSNAVGVAVSSRAVLRVEAGAAQKAGQPEWSEAVCANNLSQIALCARLWSQDSGQNMPSDLAVMTNSYGLPVFGWPVVLYCPADTNRPAPADWSGVDFNNTSYAVAPVISLDPYSVYCRCKVHGFYAQVDGVALLKPVFTAILATTNHTVDVRFRVFAGKTNVLETSSDLTNWTPVDMYPLEATGEYSYQDTADVPRRYYRVRLQ